MNLNKIIVVMLMLFMILSNALPAGAVRGKKRSVAQRKSESDSYSMDSSDDSDDDDYVDSDDDDYVDSDDGDGVDSETEDECVYEDASNLGDAPAKKRRLSSIGFDESKILVMKLGPSKVKTFNDFSGAVNWLQAHGWFSARVWIIKQAIRKLSLAYGWGWEVRDKSEELENLLRSEPKRRQLELVKNYSKKLVRTVDSGELIVMRSEETAVKTFEKMMAAAKWLRVHGWKRSNDSDIRHAIYGGWFSCGWKWEVQPKTTELEKLLDAEPTSEQIEMARNYVRKSSLSVDSTKLLVMSLGENSVKTFTSFRSAVDWLAANGWGNFSDCNSVKRAVQKSCLLCGWKWKIQNKTESLEKLLEVKPTEEQIMEAKKNCEVDETKLLVMKIEGKLIKTFVNISDATKWLESNVGILVSYLEFNIAIQKQKLVCGWNWEIQDRTEDLELLLGAIPTPEQIKRARNSPQVSIMIDSDKLIVMKFHGKLVKTFASMEDANKWLNKWGWRYKSVTRAINVGCLSCGWNWEIQKRTKDLEALLEIEPDVELIKMAKRYVRGKLVLNENELLVMKDEKNTLKTFTEISKAVKWLKLKGCNNICDSDIEKAIAEKSMIRGYTWGIQPRTKVLEDLLEANPTIK